MTLFVQTIITFFGTLLAAGLVALGEPAYAEVQMVQPDIAIVSPPGLE
jgi:hypothetical protein